MGVAGRRGHPPSPHNVLPHIGLRQSLPTRIHSLAPHSYYAQQIQTKSVQAPHFRGMLESLEIVDSPAMGVPVSRGGGFLYWRYR
jgi:hypothetical protein